MVFRKCLLYVMVMMVGGALCWVPGFAAQEPVAEAPAPGNEATAMLMRMGDFLAQAKQFSVSIRAGYDVLQETGQKIEFGESRKLTLVRPDHIRVEVERSDGEKTLVVFDGQEITVFSPKEKVFAKTPKPGDIDNAIFYLLNGLKVRLPLAMLFVTKLPSELEHRAHSVEMVEQDTSMDVPCAHIAARTDRVDFQVWIPSQGDPLPRRVLITYRDAPGQPQYWANLSEWNLAPGVPKDFFTFTPSEGVQRIAFLTELEVAKPEVKKTKKGGKK